MPAWVVIDPWADVGFHLAPALFLLLDLLFFSPPWSIPPRSALGVSSALAFGYWWWVEHCFTRNGWYPYPLFEVLSPAWRGVLFLGSAVVMTGSTVGLKWVYGRVNGWGVEGPMVVRKTEGVERGR
ncbi:hypothetical protein MMC15_008090 [Xylographa vitiligo]|nr:hypothetical protein [Xylographa vitiligo]